MSCVESYQSSTNSQGEFGFRSGVAPFCRALADEPPGRGLAVLVWGHLECCCAVFPKQHK